MPEGLAKLEGRNRMALDADERDYGIQNRMALICSYCLQSYPRRYNAFPSVEKYKEHIAKEHSAEQLKAKEG